MDMKWQPIETAPKDGTGILTYPHYVVTFWAEEEVYMQPGWVSSYDECLDLYLTLQGRNKPTHWMPLPEPPK